MKFQNREQRISRQVAIVVIVDFDVIKADAKAGHKYRDKYCKTFSNYWLIRIN